MYNGLFTEFRAIDEEVVAAACEMSREQVHQVLRELWRSQIIRYVPANSSPMIYMHEERLPVESLYISPKSYGYRKEQMIGRLRSMVEYAENRDICRSVIISKHFGDSGATECGCCDICLAKKRKQSREAVEKLEQDVKCQIVEALKDGELTLRQIARAVAASPESVTDALYRLVESGKIAIKKPDIFYIIPTGGRKE
jgi:ATP-dependent DNA helicase RecQ